MLQRAERVRPVEQHHDCEGQQGEEGDGEDEQERAGDAGALRSQGKEPGHACHVTRLPFARTQGAPVVSVKDVERGKGFEDGSAVSGEGRKSWVPHLLSLDDGTLSGHDGRSADAELFQAAQRCLRAESLNRRWRFE